MKLDFINAWPYKIKKGSFLDKFLAMNVYQVIISFFIILFLAIGWAAIPASVICAIVLMAR